ncbi:hypothetical protein FKV42_02625 [Methanolobus vulcani]|uniref:Uncharacterized protein n=1 Tax=Methanolobus vulcani TaxID=38026 RepID=A0A7Z8KQD7_9EURY|nr:hypothetical protein FKV42_02625 [Methanolobus vulcani]
MVHILRCKDLGFNDDFIVIDNDPKKAKERMKEHVMTEHKEEFESLSEFHQEEIISKMDFLLTRGCGCGVLKL